MLDCASKEKTWGTIVKLNSTQATTIPYWLNLWGYFPPDPPDAADLEETAQKSMHFAESRGAHW